MPATVRIPGRCRAIVGYDGAGLDLYCNQPTTDGGNYCLNHFSRGEDDEPWASEEFPDDEYRPAHGEPEKGK
jgi:hypothetical protein